MPDATAWSTRRVGVIGAPAFFCAFGLFLAIGEPNFGGRMMWLAISAVSAFFLARAWRVGVELTDDELIVRDQFRTRRLRLTEVARARLEPMRTASPLKNQWPYVALAVDLTRGGSRQFEGVSADAEKAVVLDELVNQINRRIGAA